MTQKFGRNFRLTIDPKDGLPPIVITMPFTVQFWMKRDVNASLNNLSIDIFNLSKANRRRVYQDSYNLQENVVNGQAQGRKQITFEVGYSTLFRIFQGDVFSASSERQGTNVVTRIEALTGIYDIAAAQTFITLRSGQALANILKGLVNEFPTLKLGGIGDYAAVLNRPVVLNGNTWALIQSYTNGQACIDNGKVYLLQDNEFLQQAIIPKIDDSTGLLETPRREQALLFITTLLEASINLFQLVDVESSIEPIYNGRYKVIGVQHQGVISGAVSGECRSTFILNAPAYFPSYDPVESL